MASRFIYRRRVLQRARQLRSALSTFYRNNNNANTAIEPLPIVYDPVSMGNNSHDPSMLPYDVDPLVFDSNQVNIVPSSSFDDSQVPCELDEPTSTFSDQLAAIYVRYRVKHNVVEAINGLLRENGHPKLPKTARAHLKTVRNTPLLSDSIAHFGFREGLMKRLERGLAHDDGNICLQLSVDGLPLFKKSEESVWPILCSVTNARDSRPFEVTIFQGKSKPPSLEDFLRPALEELKDLLTSGFQYDGNTFVVKLNSICADAPARAFIKAIVGHTGYNACERCVQTGKYVAHRMTFPELDAERRTDHSFRTKEDELHHKGDTPLATIPGLDMIHGIPLDPMHLVDLGVVKTFLNLLFKGPKAVRLPLRKRKLANRILSRLNPSYPSREFHRKRRNFKYVGNWKAVEYRSFLLYTGPVVLKKILPKEKFEHFLCLHVAIRMLSQPVVTESDINYCEQLLKYYVQHFGLLYGKRYQVYNIHSLIHLPSDCRIHGPLYSWSAYKFENHLGQLKKEVRSGNRVLSQIVRRMSERNAITILESSSYKWSPLGLASVKPGSHSDSICMTRSGMVVKVEKITQSHVYGHAYDGLTDYYQEPRLSSQMKIYVASGLQEHLSCWEISQFNRCYKCVALKETSSSFVIFPLLHNII